MRFALVLLAAACISPPPKPTGDAGATPAAECDGVGTLRTVFADDGVDLRLWSTSATVVDGALVLDGDGGGVTARAPIVLDAPFVVEAHGIQDGWFIRIVVGDASLTLQGTPLVGRIGSDPVTLGDYDPAQDAAFVVDRTDDHVVFSTRTADGATRLQATSTSTIDAIAAPFVGGNGAAVIAVSRALAPQSFCAASTFAPSLTGVEPGDGVVVLDGDGCTIDAGDDGLTISVPLQGDGVRCGYASSRALVPPAGATMRFARSASRGEEPFIALGPMTARIGPAPGQPPGPTTPDVLDCYDAVASLDRAPTALDVTTTEAGGVTCAALDDDGAVIASADADIVLPKGVVVGLGFLVSGTLDVAATGVVTSFDLR